MIPAYRVYLFDLDGTLVDSASDICGAVQATLHARGRTDVPDSTLRRYIGRHLFDLFADLGYPAEQHDPMLQEYRVIYAAGQHSRTRVYDGVPEMLESLGGLKATATTKGTPMTRVVLEQFGLIKFFNHVQGTDGFPAKPEPDVIYKSLEVFGVAPEECLMIGDAPSDMAAGRKAGVKTCGVRYGYGDPKEMAEFTPDYWIDSPSQLARLP